MNLTSSQLRRLETMDDAELHVELRRHVHRNPAEEAFYRAVTGEAIGRCLRKLDQMLSMFPTPSVVDETQTREKHIGVKVAVPKKHLTYEGSVRLEEAEMSELKVK